VVACALLVASQAQGGDPRLRWYTVQTPNFRVHYHSGLDELAQRTASLAETIRARLTAELGHAPSGVTEIVLTDDTDSANGSARVQPYNLIRLFVTAPDDMSVLGDYEDWLLLLLTHEDTHIVHIDNTSGLPALLNAIFGKLYSPNQAQPRFILEGLATRMESHQSSAGRLRSTLFDMYLRADVLEDNFARLDELSHWVRRWPGGNLWYLYGSHFVDYIYSVYGPDTFSIVAEDYGKNIVPWGINRSLRRATGKTYEELYPAWHEHLKKAYGAQADAVRARGLREGRRLTFHGRGASYPRLVPKRCQKSNGQHEILYVRDDGHERPGLYRLAVGPVGGAFESSLVTRSTGQYSSIAPDCSVVFDTTAPSRRQYYFSDLFRLASGDSGEPLRLTTGRRAREADVSRDGRSLVYVTNRSGTTTLRLSSIGASGTLSNERVLVPSAHHEQAFTPRFSPDGRRVAYGTWTAGGYRDIRIVDVASGRFVELMRDRAIDQQPEWSPDGKTLYFVSDRTGIANIYAHDLESGRTYQVSNVVNGAYMPTVSEDGTLIVYAGYTSRGFDLFALPVDRAYWLEAQAPGRELPPSPPEPPRQRFEVTSYSPLETLHPRAYELEYGTGTFGQTLTVTTSGYDAVGLHSYALALSVDTEQSEPQGSLAYGYHRLPLDLRVSAFRAATPRRDFRFSDEQPTLIEHTTGFTSGVSYALPGLFERQRVSLSYTLSRANQVLPIGSRVDPYALVMREPYRGYLGLVRLGYSYSNVEGSAFGISPEGGMSINAGIDYGDQWTASDSSLLAVSGRTIGYLEMPWLDHHVLALAFSAGASSGTYPRRGFYYTGGFADSPLLDSFTSGLLQSAFVLRGYLPRQFIGRQYQLLNAEYRFPIAYPERGVSTLPAFLSTLSGALFADYGGAFNEQNLENPLADYHLGVGGELWVDLTLGYYVTNTLRLGVARGLDSEAPGWLTYFVAAATF
jgi:hypothetical protein